MGGQTISEELTVCHLSGSMIISASVVILCFVAVKLLFYDSCPSYILK